jgi:hypothetical protein
MTAETFEYAIKKDVRNNPIVREIDRERNREMVRSVAIGVFLVAVLLFWAWQQFELRAQRVSARADAAGARASRRK